jgi:SAM-dependent methyltransferase
MNTKLAELPFTGERYVPAVGGNIELEHLHRYLLATQVVAGKTVLDIACGEGYGSARLAKVASKVIGVDISQEAVSHAQAKYLAENLEFKQGSCAAIPLAEASIDVVVSFETLEHHDQHDAMMREIKRVLKPGGALVISCPDKLEYSDKPKYHNEHHVKELYRDEFKQLLGAHFKNVSIYGQRVVYGSAIFCEDGATKISSYALADSTLEAASGLPYAVYLLAVASDTDLPVLNSGMLEQPMNETELVRDWERAMAIRNEQIANQDALINAIRTSRSWRLTKPLRFLARLIKRAKNVVFE